MSERSRRLFQNLTAEKWVNLALAASLVFYVIQIALDVVWNNTCGHLGTDYCAFWSAGRIASQYGYAKVYDLNLLSEVELGNFPSFGDPSTFAVSPFAYLPVFLPPFQLLSLLTPQLGFWIWATLNAAIFAAYLKFFYRNTLGVPLPRRLLIMIALSLPVCWNFLDGQVNVWLMICVAEFMRLAMSDRPLTAGLWLGGLLLKPQTLLLLGPALLIRRSGRIFAGLAAASAILVTASLVMVGREGITGMLRVWFGFARGIPSNYVETMMNWRMLGLHLSRWVSPLFGWAVAVVGVLLTIAAAIYVWRRPVELQGASFAGALLGILAASGLIAWHSHIHTAMILIPPLIFLARRESFAQLRVLEKWVLIPTAAFWPAYIVAALNKGNVQYGALADVLNFLRGGSEFGVNLWILLLAFRHAARNIPY